MTNTHIRAVQTQVVEGSANPGFHETFVVPCQGPRDAVVLELHFGKGDQIVPIGMWGVSGRGEGRGRDDVSFAFRVHYSCGRPCDEYQVPGNIFVNRLLLCSWEEEAVVTV